MSDETYCDCKVGICQGKEASRCAMRDKFGLEAKKLQAAIATNHYAETFASTMDIAAIHATQVQGLLKEATTLLELALPVKKGMKLLDINNYAFEVNYVKIILSVGGPSVMTISYRSLSKAGFFDFTVPLRGETYQAVAINAIKDLEHALTDRHLTVLEE